MIERVLQGTAVAIAMLAVLDPPLSLAARTRPRVSVVVQGGPSMDLPAAAGGSRRSEAEGVRAALRERMQRAFEVVDGYDSTAAAIVVAGDRYPEEAMREDARVSTVTLNAPIAPNVSIVDVQAPRAVPPATAIRISAVIDGSGVAGGASTLVVRSGAGVEVGRTSHAWSAPQERWAAETEVIPTGEPPFTFDVTVEPLDSEKTPLDNHARVRVDRAPRMRVLVFEARPSWASAFVRRALESDPRFVVSATEQAAPRAAVRTGDPPALTDAGLEGIDAIAVGGLDALTTAHVATLDRFLRERGGAVALLPDARIPQSVASALMPGITLREVLLERAAALESNPQPRIDASELLEADALPPAADVVARAPASRQPVIWSIPTGDGRLLVSGAMDAWRYRAEPQAAFDRFWRSLVSGLALSARPALDVTLSPARASAGQRIHVTTRVRALEQKQLGDRLAVAARIGSLPLRLWPEAQPGVFTGSFVADGSEAAVRVSLFDDTRPLAETVRRVSFDAHARAAAGPPLALLAATHAGIDVTPQNLTTLERHLRDTIPAESSTAVTHPMRSAWWFVGFAVCLSGEWSLRRRRGAR